MNRNSNLPVVVIPARAGSKRIDKKNTKLFRGVPIIGIAIKTALESGIFSHVIVSTEDENIKEISVGFGAFVPFLRPKDLAMDQVRADAVVGHASKWIDLNLGSNDVCCILPTTPGLHPNDLSDSYTYWKEQQGKIKTLFAVTTFFQTPFRSFSMNSSNLLRPLFPEQLLKQTNELETLYSDAGQFYWATTGTWQETQSITAEQSAGWVLPKERAIDINEPSDWELAENIINRNTQSPLTDQPPSTTKSSPVT